MTRRAGRTTDTTTATRRALLSEVGEHELAWAAGFFDGDGWAALVGHSDRLSRQPTAQINQGGAAGVPEVLLRFQAAVGVGRVAGPKITDGRQPLYWWVATSRRDVARAGALMGPWLSGQKRAQFETAVGTSIARAPISCAAWAAGLFDAEGSTSLSDHRSHAGYKCAEASVTQSGGAAVPDKWKNYIEINKVYFNK